MKNGTRYLALNCLNCFKKQFKNNSEFHTQYQKTIKENIEKGYPTKIKHENNRSQPFLVWTVCFLFGHVQEVTSFDNIDLTLNCQRQSLFKVK